MSEKYYVIYTIGKGEIPGAVSDKLAVKDRDFIGEKGLEEARRYRDKVLDKSRNPQVVKVID